MLTCQKCGQVNNDGVNFCRFCGTRFTMPQTFAPSPLAAPAPPRPYMWKTDEFQVGDARRNPLGPGQPAAQNPDIYPSFGQQMMYQAPGPMAPAGYRCPRCAGNYLPQAVRRISQSGWIVFAVLLVFFFPLFWIGLLIKEDVAECPQCGFRTGQIM